MSAALGKGFSRIERHANMSVKAREALRLRDAGLTHREIGERIGYCTGRVPGLIKHALRLSQKLYRSDDIDCGAGGA